MKAEQFVTIQGWMRTELNLKGNDLLVYAVIYGFSQAEEQRFSGSLQYLADWCGATKQGVQKNLKNLLERGLLCKTDIEKNGVKFCEYSCTVYNSVAQGIQLSCINNIDNTKEKESITINSNTTKNFEFGKPKSQKENLYSRCINLIDSYDFSVWGNIRTLLIDYLNFRISVKDKPLYMNMWKGMLNKLCELCSDDVHLYENIIKQSIERGYLSFYPINNKKEKTDVFSEHGSVRSAKYTDEELAELDELDKQRERRGLRTRF